MSSELKVNTISEYTTASGVTIDGVLIKDGEVDGVDVSAIVSGSLVLLGSADASSSTDITFDNFVDNSTYVSYKLYIDEITPSTDAQAIYFIHRSSAPADITGTYYRSGYYISMYKPSGANSSFYTNQADTNFTRTAGGFGTTANESLSCIIDIFPNNNDQLIRLINNNIYKNSDGHNYIALDASTLETATQMAGIKITMQSGNIASGKFRLFGVKG